MFQDNSEGLDDLQFNLGKIQVCLNPGLLQKWHQEKNEFPHDNLFPIMTFLAKVLTNIVGAIAESARSHENRQRLEPILESES